MKIISLNVGTPQIQTYRGKEVLTAGLKSPVAEAMLRFTNFDGDRQADLQNHGGPDKAICVYSFDHYPYWENLFGERLEPGAFSENLTLAGARESEICIGDVFQIGEAVVQVSQPRMPCSKLAGKRGQKKLPDLIHETGFSGFYLRVLREGLVKSGQTVTPLERHPAGVTIEFVNQILYKQRTDSESIRRALSVPELSVACRRSLESRLQATL
jgi:MOSC domain-containing protein YiiM